MIPSKEIFELIKSLDKGERRHFSNYSKLHSSRNKNYQLLFNAIGKQKEYDEPKLLSELKHHDFARYFPVAKNYLYEKIMESLANFHSDMSVNAKVRALIQQIELLQKKGLYSHSKKLIRKVKKNAYEEELHPALLEIISVWEQNILIEKYQLSETERLNDEIKNILSLLNESSVCNYVFLKMLGFYYSYFRTRNKKYLREATNIIQNPDFLRASNTQTYKGRQRAIEANMFYWYMKGNLNKVSYFAKEGMEHNFNHPLGLKRDSKQYFILLNNFFVITMEQKKHDVASLVLKKFDAVEHHAKTYSQKGGFYYTHSNSLLYYLRETGDIKELEKKLPAIIKDIDIYKKDINLHDRAILLSNIAVSQFCVGNYKKCLYFLNKLKTEYDLANHPELQYGYYLLSLITHYEAENYDVVPYSLQSFYRFLKRKTHLTKLEKLIITLCRKLIKAKSAQEVIAELKKFREQLTSLKEDYVSHHISKFFDIPSWLESKIKNISFGEVVAEKIK